ncbi:alpha/beta hydrolase [Actinoplanes couchii]|uniref:Esterase n=1 Tax=Actinoplanes couchii TaxID=403638 RepID=A0ABQ3XRC0_9ACTN|nr:esterase [Actinoplanes couchii]
MGLAVAGPAAPVHAAADPHLPTPSGSRPVGTTTLHLTDTSRPDPWVPNIGVREMMVSLWHPARVPGTRRAAYLTPTESRLLLEDAGLTDLPSDLLSTVRTNAWTDAAPAGRRHGSPLIVLSPGFGKPRSELTGLAEDLASHGYVVVAVEHTYESVATTFPDWRVTTCAACDHPIRDTAFWRKATQGRAADVSFVLDQLPRRSGAALIDPDRIGMSGQSVGGAATQAAMVTDPRIRAGIDVDGLTAGEVSPGLARPFLFLGRQDNFSPGMPAADTWERDWPLLTGWKRWLVVDGAVHSSFTDLALIAEQIGIDLGAELRAPRGTAITLRYVRAFFDLHLRNRPTPLFTGPSAACPESIRSGSARRPVRQGGR